MERCSFDHDYVESLRVNDPRVLEHFAAYFRELLLIKLRRRVRSPEIAGDLIQETFLRVLTALRADGIRSAPSLGAFVDSVCNNVLREHYRSEGRTAGFPEDSPGPRDPRAGPEDELVTRQTQKHVQAVLGKLPVKDRELLRRVFFEEEDKDQICRALGVDREYLRVLLHRARNRFRELLQSEGGWMKRFRPPGH